MNPQKRLPTISFMEYDTGRFDFSDFARTACIMLLVFAFLTMFQVSFLAHFPVLGFVPHIVLFLYILIHVLEKPHSGLGTMSALAAGFFLDVYSSRPFGFYTALLSAGSLAITILKAHYVRFPHF
ncbi:MAG: hypothetical protein A3J57_00610 [Candidatus Wildermuthbacteria bacterium RIFCSPHIGHO2_02_FULL_49_12b]|nr:MAG: hypothetical protein A3J57_00610 [Candidatus Wildermuthbacteria bacterium RIFCSPHIGHO2_02_FULL_49_12b]